MSDPKMMSAWLRLMAEAMQGTAEAQEAVRAFADTAGKPEDAQRWLKQFMPGLNPTIPLDPTAYEAWLEDTWRMMGVVPRKRYLELLEKCDTLERHLAKAEKTIADLRARLDTQGQQAESTQQVMNMWGSMVEDTLKVQTEWMQNWSKPNQAGEDEGEDEASSSEQS